MITLPGDTRVPSTVPLAPCHYLSPHCVVLVRTTFGGQVEREEMSLHDAVWALWADEDNGVRWASGHIEYGGAIDDYARSA